MQIRWQVVTLTFDLLIPGWQGHCIPSCLAATYRIYQVWCSQSLIKLFRFRAWAHTHTHADKAMPQTTDNPSSTLNFAFSFFLNRETYLYIHCNCLFCWQPITTESRTPGKKTTTTTTISRLFGLCPGQPGWASTRRNIHPLTPIVVINYPLSASSIFYHLWRPCSLLNLHAWQSFSTISLQVFWSTSWPGTLYFILHTFLHSIIVFISQHMPIPS